MRSGCMMGSTAWPLKSQRQVKVVSNRKLPSQFQFFLFLLVQQETHHSNSIQPNKKIERVSIEILIEGFIFYNRHFYVTSWITEVKVYLKALKVQSCWVKFMLDFLTPKKKSLCSLECAYQKRMINRLTLHSQKWSELKFNPTFQISFF